MHLFIIGKRRLLILTSQCGEEHLYTWEHLERKTQIRSFIYHLHHWTFYQTTGQLEVGTIYKKQRPDETIWRLKLQCRQALNFVLVTSTLDPFKANPNTLFPSNQIKIKKKKINETYIRIFLFICHHKFSENFSVSMNFVSRTTESGVRSRAFLFSQYLDLGGSRPAWATRKGPVLFF